MSTDGNRHGAEVISLDKFREKIEAPQETADDRYERFKPVDYGTNTSARRMLRYLNGQAAPDKLAIFVTDDPKKPTDVVASEQQRSWGYAVVRNIDQLEALTLDLEYGNENREVQLREPMDRFCTLAFIAHHAIVRDNRSKSVPQPELPLRVMGEEVNLSDPNRLAFVNSWRAAGGLALIGVTEGRPSLRSRMREYLNNLLSSRLEYAQDMQFIASISEQYAPRDGFEIGDDFLGLCNPLDEFELRRVVTDLHGSHAD